jgi:hypothetical protein
MIDNDVLITRMKNATVVNYGIVQALNIHPPSYDLIAHHNHHI